MFCNFDFQIQRENQLDRQAFFEMEYKQAETHRTKHEGDDDEDHDNNDGNMTSLDTVYFRDNADLVNKDDVRKRTA